jgi:hypothetical protein
MCLSHYCVNLKLRDCNYIDDIRAFPYKAEYLMFFRIVHIHKICGFDPSLFLHYEVVDIVRLVLSVAEVNYVSTVRVIVKWARKAHKIWRSKLMTIKSDFYYHRNLCALNSNNAWTLNIS